MPEDDPLYNDARVEVIDDKTVLDDMKLVLSKKTIGASPNKSSHVAELALTS